VILYLFATTQSSLPLRDHVVKFRVLTPLMWDNYVLHVRTLQSYQPQVFYTSTICRDPLDDPTAILYRQLG
jgi:hypothetical protein